MNFMTSLIKKYLNNNLRVLAKIQKLIRKNNSVYYSDIEFYLNRGRNQVSAILAKLEGDNLIKREKKKDPKRFCSLNQENNCLQLF